MRFFGRLILVCAGVFVAAFLTACGSGSGQAVPSLIRVVNVSSASVALTLNETYDTNPVPKPSQSSASNPFAGAYIQVPPGTYSSSAYATGNCTGTCPTATSTVVGLGTGDSYTTVAFNRGASLYSFTITDNLAAPANGYVTLAAANMSPDAGALDIYVLPHSALTSLVSSGSTLVPTWSSIQDQETEAVNVAPGNYDIFVTAAGNPSDIRFHTSSIQLATGQIAVLALTDTSGGSLVDATLINQGEDATYYQSDLARVRVIGALSGVSGCTTCPGIVVSIAGVTVTGSTQISGSIGPVYTPQSSGYQLVELSQGNTVTSITVSGTPLTTLPTTTFASGQDYTLLVYGTSAAPAAQIFQDNNLITSSQASVRLINAIDQSAGGDQMYIDGRGPVTALYGQASSYFGLTPYVPDTVDVISSDYNQSFSYSLVVGNVYTFVVYDLTLPPLTLEDR